MENLGWLSGAAGLEGAGFAHFCTQKASGDKAVTSGDKLSGLEFAGFLGQKTDFGAVFGGKRANLEAQAAHLTPDTSWPFSALFAPKTERRRSGDIAGDKRFLGEKRQFWSVFGPTITNN